MNVLGTIGVIFLLAFLVESLVEAAFGGWINEVPALEKRKGLVLLYIAFAVGVAAAFIYRFDLVHTVSVWLNAEVAVHPFGIAMTGLAIGRGSHFVHDIFTKFIANPPLEPIASYVYKPAIEDADMDEGIDLGSRLNLN